MRARELLKLLKKDGWYEVEQRGSHVQLKHPVKPGKVTVPDHGSKDIPIGTARQIMKQAGIE